jgi:Asp-tRNA(Asn)/Glu-tRNA(Gln) amidotransferase A subunit family amidase
MRPHAWTARWMRRRWQQTLVNACAWPGPCVALHLPLQRPINPKCRTAMPMRTLNKAFWQWPVPELPDTMAGLQHALACGEWSVVQALDAQRRRLRQHAGRLNFVVRDLAGSQDDASAPQGCLAGVGLAHKDIFDLAGWRPGLGRDLGAASPGLATAPAVDRLTRQGATPLATLAMSEHACGATGANPHFPRCVNPLRADAVVGGSSSGSAVAVAAGLAYGSLATDTAGSVRIPAATCGVLGLKTTQGRVPRNGVYPLAPGMDTVGLMTRSATDAARLLDVVAPLPELDKVPDRPLRICAWIPDAGVDAQVAAALESLLADLPGVRRIDDWPDFRVVSQLADVMLHGQAALTHATALREGVAAPAVREVALPGSVMPTHWLPAAQADRPRRLKSFVSAYLTDCDLFLLPALAEPVPDWTSVTPGQPEYQPSRLLALYRFMGFVNYLGLPAIVFPIAADARGMPISVQLVARPFHEHVLLAFADAVQQQRFDGAAFTRRFQTGN